ncbi:hypothetical protein M758_UG329000 [Ceratodon purpureus]|nr:hypothetical protein M758_UG329000 [Ceratodon purpureus]
MYARILLASESEAPTMEESYTVPLLVILPSEGAEFSLSTLLLGLGCCWPCRAERITRRCIIVECTINTQECNFTAVILATAA